MIAWDDLEIVIARPKVLAVHAPALADAYNDPHNMGLLAHTTLATPADVREHYAALTGDGGVGFVLLRDGQLAGDGDLRRIDRETKHGEIAFLIASPAAQGKGLGTRFATMLGAYAFLHLKLATLYASILPDNVGSRRVFEKLGFAVDDSETAGRFADPGDVVMSIDELGFLTRHRDAVLSMRWEGARGPIFDAALARVAKL